MKFHIDDVVIGVRNDVCGDIMRIEEITPEGWLYLSCLNMGDRWKSHLDLDDNLILRRRCTREDSIELYNDWYKNTYIAVNNQEEFTMALKFYEDKGFNPTEYRTRHPGYDGKTYYVKWFSGGSNECFGLSSTPAPAEGVDITADVINRSAIHLLWGGANAACGTPGMWDEKFIDGTGVQIRADVPYGVTDSYITVGYQGKVFQSLGTEYPKYKNTFNSLFKKTMNSLRCIIFNELDLKKLAKLVETTEAKLDPIDELIERLKSLSQSTKQEIKHMENAVEEQNKKGIETAKKLIEEQNEVLDDKLMEQLLTIGEKLFK